MAVDGLLTRGFWSKGLGSDGWKVELSFSSVPLFIFWLIVQLMSPHMVV